MRRRRSNTPADIGRTDYPPPRIGNLTDAFSDPAKAIERIRDAAAWSGPDADGKWARSVLDPNSEK